MGWEGLKCYLLLNPGGDLQLLNRGFVTPVSAALEAGAPIGEDLIPIAFLGDPDVLVADPDTLEVCPIESEEDFETS